MARYKCVECGCEFEEPGSYRECMGEYWGMPAYETFYCCPECKGDFGEIDENGEYIDD